MFPWHQLVPFYNHSELANKSKLTTIKSEPKSPPPPNNGSDQHDNSNLHGKEPSKSRSQEIYFQSDTKSSHKVEKSVSSRQDKFVIVLF